MRNLILYCYGKIKCVRTQLYLSWVLSSFQRIGTTQKFTSGFQVVEEKKAAFVEYCSDGKSEEGNDKRRCSKRKIKNIEIIHDRATSVPSKTNKHNVCLLRYDYIYTCIKSQL